MNYSNWAAEGESLPPISGSLDLHICHTYYITMIKNKEMKIIHASQNLLHLVGHLTGSSHFAPVGCLNLPAPEAMLHLVKCSCKRGCEGRCSCRQNNIPRTELCGCWVFTCNNKRSQPGINEECEDD